jgi:(2S)-methylsuccinyl-CoA dehydrogenase
VDVSLEQARTLVTAAAEAVRAGVARLARDCGVDGRVDLARVDREQVLAYDLASVASMVAAAEELLAWGEGGGVKEQLTVAFAGHVAAEVGARLQGREADWTAAPLPWQDGDAAKAFAAARSPALLDRVAERVLAAPDLPRDLSEELEMARQAFRDFTEAKVKPIAEQVHREDRDIPEDVISGLASMGSFGLSIPQQYGGYASGEGHSASDFMSMVVVTEELSRGSLGAAGSLIARPEILAKALVKGGPEEQQQRWLPRIASGELMVAVAVTEPDYGSDVASLATTAKRDGEHYVVNGVKTWCTFGARADVLMLLARTDPDRSKAHRGLPVLPGHGISGPVRNGVHGWAEDIPADTDHGDGSSQPAADLQGGERPSTY